MARLDLGFILARRFTLCALGNFVGVLRLAADEGDRSRPILCAWPVLSPTMEPIASSSGIAVPVSGGDDSRGMPAAASAPGGRAGRPCTRRGADLRGARQ